LLVIVLALWGLLRLPLAMPAVLNALAMLSTSMEGDDGFKFGAGKITRLGYARYRGRPAGKPMCVTGVPASSGTNENGRGVFPLRARNPYGYLITSSFS
jgi:hypothetical protein